MHKNFSDELKKLKNKINTELKCLNDSNIALKATIVGAFCSLKLALEEGYDDDIDKKLDNNYLYEIIKDEEYKDEEKLWNAGLHYNSTLYRISSAYHRILKILVYGDRDDYPRDYINELKKKLGIFNICIKTEKLDNINTLVNNLKHNVFGNSGTRIKVEDLFKSFDELIKLIKLNNVK